MNSKLRDIRVLKRVTQFDLRMKTDISQSKISLMEHGYIVPREDEKMKLAKALGVMMGEIFPDEGTDGAR